jgi:pectate lyase
MRHDIFAAILSLVSTGALFGCSAGRPQSPGEQTSGNASAASGADAGGKVASVAGTFGALAGAPAQAGRAGNSASASAGTDVGAGGHAAQAGSGAAIGGAGGQTAGALAGASGSTTTTAGTGATASSAGTSGNADGAGTSGAAGGGSTTSACSPWPAATTMETLTDTIKVTGTYDGKLKRFVAGSALGDGGQSEDQKPLFELADGATLTNVVIGSPAADGVHCKGTCVLQNVWWEDVGEDAATFEGTTAAQTMTVECSGARHASDKVLQHNGPGTFIVRNFFVEDFGKIYRSCGNCKKQYERHVELSDISASGGKLLVGINDNYKDSARFHNITIHDSSMKTGICERFTGNDTGAEPPKSGIGADATYCIYTDSDIHWVP